MTFARPAFTLSIPTTAGPRILAARNAKTVLSASDGELSKNFFELLRRNIQATRKTVSAGPFTSGWIGYIGYEMYSDLDLKIAPRAQDLIPRSVFAYFDSTEILKPENVPPENKVSLSQIKDFPAYSNVSKENYRAAVSRVKDLISAGDCYQVNLSQKFTVPISESPEKIYQRLQTISPAPYSAYLDLGDAKILSASPELFLSVDGDHVVTRPVKGTRPRGRTPEEDLCLKEELAHSPKDHAELLMITDLERNDLGRVCIPGSIRVTDIGSVETYAQVHHRVSTIEGRLAPDKDIVDLLQAMFPGGSITGAPKVRAMQIIRELEPHAREIYCGAIGFIGDDGRAQFNVAIRTMVIKDGRAHLWSGGGIVADSDPDLEYEESLVKARGMMRALGL
jgi:aminodeoxychorismate synthase component I